MDENRSLQRHSATVRASVAAETMASSRSTASWTSFLDTHTVATSGLGSPFTRSIAPPYETAYGTQFGANKKLRRLTKRAKAELGVERTRAISKWGAEPSVERLDI
mmetsp:Transcript_142952/g.262740  ORF Transcript_142952/g.262740 Transcript_142952/m.262740 type:complete len:106 (-) Transcript_142952:54-371(-)